MYKFGRKYSKFGIITLALLLILGTVTVYAAPSIADLHGSKQDAVVSDMSTDGTNTASILSETDIYLNDAIKEQYMYRKQDGTLTDTPLSSLVEGGRTTIEETDTNGNHISDDILTVKEMMNQYCTAAGITFDMNCGDLGVDLSNLDQLTYWLDFKYEATDYRIEPNDTVGWRNKNTVLENGMFSAEINGGEILRAGRIDDYIIIQIDAENGEVHYLRMNDYEPKNGKYVIGFPCIGPYLITMVNQGQ